VKITSLYIPRQDRRRRQAPTRLHPASVLGKTVRNSHRPLLPLESRYQTQLVARLSDLTRSSHSCVAGTGAALRSASDPGADQSYGGLQPVVPCIPPKPFPSIRGRSRRHGGAHSLRSARVEVLDTSRSALPTRRGSGTQDPQAHRISHRSGPGFHARRLQEPRLVPTSWVYK
jgi:hypothetical protein